LEHGLQPTYIHAVKVTLGFRRKRSSDPRTLTRDHVCRFYAIRCIRDTHNFTNVIELRVNAKIEDGQISRRLRRLPSL
jgi:hypothetical protein